MEEKQFFTCTYYEDREFKFIDKFGIATTKSVLIYKFSVKLLDIVNITHLDF